jgi:hypothetical protein
VPVQRWQVLLAGGLAGVASLLLVPFEALAPSPIPHFTLRALAAIQPAILTVLAVLLGEVTARRVGLRAPLVDAWISGAGSGRIFRRQIGPAMAAGAAVAAILIAYSLTVGQSLVSGAGAKARLASFDLPLATKLLYGGITEELLTRWALVSLFAWVGWRFTGCRERTSTAVLAASVVLAAVLFGAGHLPLLFLIAPSANLMTVLAVLAANVLPGMLFGWLYVRRGLEAAVIAHMTAHALSTLATFVL